MPAGTKSMAKGRPSKGPTTDDLAQVLKLPDTGPIPEPMHTFQCPLCPSKTGRKAIASHLRTYHQFDRPVEFDFIPMRDVLPGRLTCAHCKATFSVEQAPRTHFQRASCPVRLCQMASDLHFGAPVVPDSEVIPAFQVKTMQFDSPGLIGRHWQSNNPEPFSQGLVHPCLIALTPSLTFWPKHRLHWHVHLMTWFGHWNVLPQVCLDLTWICNLLQYLTEQLPFAWAWASDDWELIAYDQIFIPEKECDQLLHVLPILYQLEHTLAQDIRFDSRVPDKYARDATRRSGLSRPHDTLGNGHERSSLDNSTGDLDRTDPTDRPTPPPLRRTTENSRSC